MNYTDKNEQPESLCHYFSPASEENLDILASFYCFTEKTFCSHAATFCVDFPRTGIFWLLWILVAHCINNLASKIHICVSAAGLDHHCMPLPPLGPCNCLYSCVERHIVELVQLRNCEAAQSWRITCEALETLGRIT